MDLIEPLHAKIFVPDSAEIVDIGNNQTQGIFHNEVFFRLEVRNGSSDGDGIESVTFKIRDDDGPVHERTERQAGYCVFGGGEPNCNVRFPGDDWDIRKTILKGTRYDVDIEVDLKQEVKGKKTVNWLWEFKIAN